MDAGGFAFVTDNAPHARLAQPRGAGVDRAGAEPRAPVRSQTRCAGFVGRCALPCFRRLHRAG